MSVWKRCLLIAAVAAGLGGCVAYPADPYYGGGYYAAPPVSGTVVIDGGHRGGGGWNHGRRW
jgi:hypothetical protein